MKHFIALLALFCAAFLLIGCAVSLPALGPAPGETGGSFSSSPPESSPDEASPVCVVSPSAAPEASPSVALASGFVFERPHLWRLASALFTFRTGPEPALGGNAEYVELLSSRICPAEACEEGSYLHLCAQEVLALDGLCALYYTVENRSSLPLYVLCTADDVSIGGCPPDSFSGRLFPDGVVLLPGETADCCFKANQQDSVPEFLSLSVAHAVFSLDWEKLPENRKAPRLDSSRLTFLGEEILSLSVPVSRSTVCSALPGGMPVERDFPSYTLRITRADLSDSSACFVYERIYPTEEAALAHDPCDARSGWDYFLNYEYGRPGPDGNGQAWVQVGGGEIADFPVPLADGRWSWKITKTVDFMNARPQKILMLPVAIGESGAIPVKEEAVLLKFVSTGP